MFKKVRRERLIGLFCLLLPGWGVFLPGQAQKDNRFEVSKNLDIFNALVKEVEMFYVDSVDVEKNSPERDQRHVEWAGPLYCLLSGTGYG